MGTNKIFDHFSKTVDNYDTVADKVVMKNDELHSVLIDAMTFKNNARLKVLDLGSGTGHGMHLVLDKYPYSSVTGVDFSSKMIAISKKNLRKYSNRVTLIKNDFNFVPFGNQYDAIVSAVAIHNSTHGQKRNLFSTIYSALKKSGTFINGDFIKGENKEIDLQYQRIYKNYLKNNLLGQELVVWLRHAFYEDAPMKLSSQFKYLTLSGFKKIELLWQYNNEAVYKVSKDQF